MESDTQDQFEQAIDDLIEYGVVTVEDDVVYTTQEYDEAMQVYHDTYANCGDDLFHSTIADVFGLDEDVAEARVEELGVTRAELVSYLTLQGFIDDSVPQERLTLFAQLVTDLEPQSPIPESMTELDDASYRSYIDEHGDVLVVVWKRHCAPCDELKDDWDKISDAIPDGVAVAGVDGESIGQFRDEFGIEAAPTALFFQDGELTDRVRGRPPTDELIDIVTSVYA